MSSAERPETAVLPVIYAAMAGGVAILAGAAVLFLGRSAAAPQVAFRVAWLAAAAAGLLLGRAVRARFEKGERTAEAGVRTAILVWALGEGPALVGLLVYLLNGDRAVLVLALVVFTWILARNPPGAFRPQAG